METKKIPSLGDLRALPGMISDERLERRQNRQALESIPEAGLLEWTGALGSGKTQSLISRLHEFHLTHPSSRYLGWIETDTLSIHAPAWVGGTGNFGWLQRILWMTPSSGTTLVALLALLLRSTTWEVLVLHLKPSEFHQFHEADLRRFHLLSKRVRTPLIFHADEPLPYAHWLFQAQVQRFPNAQKGRKFA